MSRNRSLLRYGRCSCDLYSRYSVWFPCISTQLSALPRTEVYTLLKIPGFTRISWQAFSTRCCYTSKSSIGVEYTKVFRCPHRGLRSGDRAGQLTGPPLPIHCSPKVWFRCCLTMPRQWVGAPSCMNRMCCRWWRGTCSKGSGRYTVVVLEGFTPPSDIASCDILFVRNHLMGSHYFNRGRYLEGYNGRSKQVATDWLQEVFRHLEPTLECICSCRTKYCHVIMSRYGFYIGNWIYWPHNYK
jgi:hypothetical protein